MVICVSNLPFVLKNKSVIYKGYKSGDTIMNIKTMNIKIVLGILLINNEQFHSKVLLERAGFKLTFCEMFFYKRWTGL